MRPSVVFAVLALAPLMSACAILGPSGAIGRLYSASPAATPPAPEPLPGQLEPIHAAAIGQDQAVFWVSSNGCTQKADLTPVVRREGEDSVITLRRVKEDRCVDVRPEGVEVRWSFRELGLEPGARVSVENPYQMPPG